jgi:hypothetical protein
LQQATSDNKRTPGSSGSALRTVGWITGATLTAGAITFGLLAVKESNDLKNARSTFPTPSGTLTHDANLVTTYAVIADSLTAAAVVVGGATLLSALWPSSSSPTSPRSGALVPVRLGIGLGSASLQATF